MCACVCEKGLEDFGCTFWFGFAGSCEPPVEIFERPNTFLFTTTLLLSDPKALMKI